MTHITTNVCTCVLDFIHHFIISVARTPEHTDSKGGTAYFGRTVYFHYTQLVARCGNENVKHSYYSEVTFPECPEE